MTLNQKRLQSDTEELLGLRGPKGNRAVRWNDLDKIAGRVDMQAVRDVAERVARDIAEEYGGNIDLSDLHNLVDEAQRVADEAATEAQNANTKAQQAHAYADDLVSQARSDMAVDFAAAQTAASQALGAAYDAANSLLTATAGVARLFPADFRDGATYWRADGSGDPAAAGFLPPDSSLQNEAAVGNFVRFAKNRAAVRVIFSRGVADYQQGRTIRVTAKLRMVGGVNSAVAMRIATLADGWTGKRVLANNVILPVALPDIWTLVSAEFTLPAPTAGEVAFRVGIGVSNGITPDVPIDVAMIRIEDVTLAKEAANYSTQAGISRDSAVVARGLAEDAAASALDSMEMSAAVAGRGVSVLSDQFLVSSDWGRFGGAGTRTVLSNALYPLGRTWRFQVTAAQNDGAQIIDSPDTIWPGQTDAAAYVIEVEFTLISGTLNGAGARISWKNSTNNEFAVNLSLADMQAGEGLSGRSRVARGVFVKPSNFSGTFVSHRLFVFANWDGGGFTRAAKTIEFHRISVRPASLEEMGSGQVMAQVQAHLSQTYLTRAETNSAIANADLSLNASLAGMRASVQQSSTAIASLSGSVARFTNIVTVDGEKRAGIEAVAFNGSGIGTGSVLKLIGDDVIAEGTLSAGRVVVHDGSGNLFPDPQFSLLSLAGWTGNGSAHLYPIRTSAIPGGVVMNNAPATTVLFLSNHAESANRYLTSPPFELAPNSKLDLAFDYSVSSGGNHSLNFRLLFYDNTDTIITTAGTTIHTAPANWQRYSAEVTAPANTVRARIQILSLAANMNNWACATNFSVIRKRSGATLIEPNSLTTREIYTDDFAAKGLAVFGGTLQSDNFNAANNTGWRIQKNGTLNMPKAFIKSAHLDDAVIKGAHIG
ncbi:hypothetical protein, partial [Paracoccus sp. (in: a-proteobacteria)]|uniref:hypothetical protein n=1 Tax=Paracoccus sp. TaxID=267 RepID=UPI0028AB46F6